MRKPQVDKLYVNLTASQARRRLKGHGFGVRRVESCGRRQCIIFHTATGGHLTDLKALFADAQPCETEAEQETPIEALRNLGPASAAWLSAVGISTAEELRRVGAVFAYRLVRQRFPAASLNLLWAMAAGLADRDWRELTDDEKQRLREEAHT
ncbi:MAG: TfoX/Sxy family protein [Planctomycetales bacterium]|nr:TfoX/Sxy family protein [Planctomycetales bacterium]